MLYHVTLIFNNNYNILCGMFIRRDKYDSNIAYFRIHISYNHTTRNLCLLPSVTIYIYVQMNKFMYGDHFTVYDVSSMQKIRNITIVIFVFISEINVLSMPLFLVKFSTAKWRTTLIGRENGKS